MKINIRYMVYMQHHQSQYTEADYPTQPARTALAIVPSHISFLMCYDTMYTASEPTHPPINLKGSMQEVHGMLFARLVMRRTVRCQVN